MVQNSGCTKKGLIQKSPNVRFSLRPATKSLSTSCKLYQSLPYKFKYIFLHIQQICINIPCPLLYKQFYMVGIKLVYTLLAYHLI